MPNFPLSVGKKNESSIFSLCPPGTESAQGEPDIDIPKELQLQEARLEKIGEIKAELKQRAQARYDQEKTEYDDKVAKRSAKEKARGRKLGGKPPKSPEPGPQAKELKKPPWIPVFSVSTTPSALRKKA